MPAELPHPINGPYLILGEGSDDKAFFEELIAHHGLATFQVGSVGGKDNFGDVLGGLKTNSGFHNLSKIIVVGDNDTDSAVAFSNIRDQIGDAGQYGVPNEPLTVAHSSDCPGIAVMMLPWADLPGCLETLCLQAALQAKPDLEPCLDSYAVCTTAATFDESKGAKMRLRCLLAATCRSDPNTGLRYAWKRTETLIPIDSSAFDQVVSFLKNLHTP